MSAIDASGLEPVGVTQARVTRSEWTKLRSVRSTRWALLAALVLIIAVGVIVCLVFESRWPHLDPRERARFSPLRSSLTGVNLAQLAFGVLGVLTISAEYSTGMIRSTFSAVPSRLPVLWGKALVFAAVALAVSLPAVFIVFFIGQGILSGRHINTALSHAGVLRTLIGAGLFMTAMGLFGLGLGAICRSTAAGISALVAIMFVLPPIVEILPSSVTDTIDKFMPSNAGGAIWRTDSGAHLFSPWAGFAVFCGYIALVLLIAAVLMRRRDT